ncbi:acyltransferase [Limosilactobacillus frumenti]|uniref:acyltransferase n=1 Tax=Limosilactobacillus frumenti TaxID=104955 RepID=UPI001F2C954D|nr:acyltransferase [Limosilactobacillus frumenti]
MKECDDMQNLGSASSADIGDFEKLFAVTTVMMQSVISFLMSDHLPVGQQFFLGGIYEVVKFSASAFIFGILFSTIRTHPHAHLKDYPRFMVNRWHVLFIPSIMWTTIYLLLLPQLQQHRHYHNIATFCWQFINGNAAPHLWYNVMMLQFIILMPFFWALARWCHNRPHRAVAAFTITLLFELAWHWLYKLEIFHGPQAQNWYLFDRVFPSFIIFAVSGTLLWTFHGPLCRFAMRHWGSAIVVWCILLYYVTLNFFNYGTPVSLDNAPYYLPSMIFYNLSSIILIAMIATYMQKFRNQWLPLVHWIALYAHRAYLSHVFWLYWSWQLLNHWSLSLMIKFPLMIGMTIFLAFMSAYGLHILWSSCKQLFHIHHIVNG